MSEELLYFNGINGDTGAYDLDPMTAARLFDVLRGAAEPENIKELEYRVQWETEEHLGVVEGVDPTRIDEAGWGAIFPADVDGAFVPAVKDALKPLLDLRKEQAGDLFRIYEGVDAVRPGESKIDFLVRHGVPPADSADPQKMPYYLLLVGDPAQISYRFQSQLDVQYAVGRIHFETVQEYANYAASVVAAETGQVSLAKEAAFFGVMNDDDPATALSTTKLMEPLLTEMQSTLDDWQMAGYLRDQATKGQLANLLGGANTPALLFTGSHGVPFDRGSSRQVPHQGALLCQDWPGPRNWAGGEISQDYYFAGDDLTSDTNLLGMMAFFFACYGGGTPLHDDFARPGTSTPEQIADRPFVARLPMQMLGREKGGALAVIAHVERAWGSSFVWTRNIEQIGVFKSTLLHLMEGKPVGSALEYFNSRYATWATELSTTLRDVQFGLQVEPFNISSMWTAHNDARGYAIIGDPAVRLPLAQEGSQPQERSAITVAPVNGSDAAPVIPNQPAPSPEAPADSPPVAEAPEDQSLSPGPAERAPTQQHGPATISTYTAEEAAATERTLLAQTEIRAGAAIDTTVYGRDAAANAAMLNLHSEIVGHALGRAGSDTTGPVSDHDSRTDLSFGIETPQEPETSIPIGPVERPQPVEDGDVPFLVEVSDFLWVRQARNAFNVDGDGLTVAVLDTGLNAGHVDFAGRVLAQVNYTADNNGDDNNADDGDGHGTNVGGIIVAGSKHTGMAPGANIIPLKVLPNVGLGDFGWVKEALQWVIDHRAEHNITAVCMSLGDRGNFTDDNFGAFAFLRNSIRSRIQTLRDERVAVVIAAGNEFFPHESKQGMAFPAIIRECVSVGAVYDADGGGFTYNSGAISTSSKAGQITPFSQRLHTSVNTQTHTDIFGPGAPVLASGIDGPEASSIQYHGTSQATPAVAGLILLMQQFYQRERGELPTVDQLISWLQQGGVPIFDGDDEADNVQHTNLTYIRVDALSALDAARRAIQNLELTDIMKR